MYIKQDPWPNLNKKGRYLDRLKYCIHRKQSSERIYESLKRIPFRIYDKKAGEYLSENVFTYPI